MLVHLLQAHDEAAQQRAASSALAHQLEEAGMELQDAKDAGRQLAVLLAAVAEGRCTGAHIKGSGLVDDYLTGRGGAGGARRCATHSHAAAQAVTCCRGSGAPCK